MLYRIELLLLLVLLQAIHKLDSYSCDPQQQSATGRSTSSDRIVRDQATNARLCKREFLSSQSDCKSCNYSGPTSSDAKMKASNIAQKAAQEARAASDAQMAAAEAAAQQVKCELAERAAQSARAAEAALAGKQQIVEQLETEMVEAESVVNEITTSLQSTQNNANLAMQAAVEAQNQLHQLKCLVSSAAANLASIENVANGCQQELAEKTQLLEAAKNRYECLGGQIREAKSDYEKTKKAAYKAACSAVEAKQKASRTSRAAFKLRTLRKAAEKRKNRHTNTKA